MSQIINCAPNLSAARNEREVEALRAVLTSAPGITIAGESVDLDHNRTCFEYYGAPADVIEATVRLAVKAAEVIDMTKHTGAHPRMGALDVAPLTPLKDITMDEVVELARGMGKRIWEEAHIPVFFYENAATAPYRANLSDIRKGQFEGMAEKIKQDEWAPDFGERAIHPTAGVTAVGARMPLMAFNVNLDTKDVSVAKKIAKIVRYSSGGFKYVKAIGLEYKDMTQVSMDITDYTKVPLYRVLEVIRFEAARYNVHVVSTELIGATPMMALIESALYYLQNDGNFDDKTQIIENRLMN